MCVQMVSDREDKQDVEDGHTCDHFRDGGFGQGDIVVGRRHPAVSLIVRHFSYVRLLLVVYFLRVIERGTASE